MKRNQKKVPYAWPSVVLVKTAILSGNPRWIHHGNSKMEEEWNFPKSPLTLKRFFPNG